MTNRIQTAIVIAAAILAALSALACQDAAPSEPTPAPAPEAPTSAPAASSSVTGTVSYESASALPPDAELTVRLEDVSRADAASVTIAEQVITNLGQSPIRFEIAYDPADIDERFDYAILARITQGDRLLFINDTVYGVLTRGYPDSVDMVLVDVRQ